MEEKKIFFMDVNPFCNFNSIRYDFNLELCLKQHTAMTSILSLFHASWKNRYCFNVHQMFLYIAVGNVLQQQEAMRSERIVVRCCFIATLTFYHNYQLVA